MLTDRRRRCGSANELVVLDEKTFVVRVQEVIKLMFELHRSPHALLEFLIFLGHNVIRSEFRLVVFVVVLADVVDVGEPSQLLPAANCLENGHVLVVRVVASSKAVEDVTKGLLALQVFLVLTLQGPEGKVVFDE